MVLAAGDDPHAGAARAQRARRDSRTARPQSVAAPGDGGRSRGWTRPWTWHAACPRASTSTSSRPRGSCSRRSPGRPRTSRCRFRSPAARHADAMAAYPQLAQVGLMVSDSGRGEVHEPWPPAADPLRPGRAEVEKFRAGIGGSTRCCAPPGRARCTCRCRRGPSRAGSRARPQADGLPPARHRPRRRPPGPRRASTAISPSTASPACTSPTARSCRARPGSIRS